MQTSRIVLMWLALFLPFVATGCSELPGDPLAAEGADENPAELARQEDTEAREMLANKETIAEARKWLTENDEKHVLWKGDRTAITGLVNDLYEAGAVQVYVVEISREGDVEIAANFVAELPGDAAKRLQVLATHNAFWKKYIDDEEELKDFVINDHGQKYLIIGFDL